MKIYGLIALFFSYVVTYERYYILASLMKSQIFMDHRGVRSMSTVRHPSYYRFTGVYIFLYVLIISLAPDPTYGQSGFRSVDGLESYYTCVNMCA